MLFARFHSLRYISLIAVVSLFVGSFLMFLAGTEHTLSALLLFIIVPDMKTLPPLKPDLSCLRHPCPGS
ncbi:MAG: hypothetical protein WCX22_04995 [Methanoregula sp.]